jgi:hypothetical protein
LGMIAETPKGSDGQRLCENYFAFAKWLKNAHESRFL